MLDVTDRMSEETSNEIMYGELSLFVYGSLSEGMVHFHKISQYIKEKQRAWATGVAYRLPSGYPVFLLGDSSSFGVDRVPGQIVKLRGPELVFKMLDEFHGFSSLVPEKSLFFKEKIHVETENQEMTEVFVYAMNRVKLPKAACRIHSGDWISNLQEQPPLTEQLTERQAMYVKKLSASSGREIVPIDLTLYRELMKLDLIVDKGRRLALSPLGKEVSRYLPE